jgi:hypothetical protein
VDRVQGRTSALRASTAVRASKAPTRRAVSKGRSATSAATTSFLSLRAPRSRS